MEGPAWAASLIKADRRKEMYKTQTQNFILANNIGLEVVREQEVGETHYALVRIGIFGKTTYGICVLGDGYAMETLGECEKEAEETFELIMREGAAPEHIFDIVTDRRRERSMGEF